MRTKLFIAVAALFLFALTFYVPREASAVPAFARQTGMACNSCHYQHFPTLNAFGRAFKAGGYTMVGGQSLIEGDFLSLPSTLNASLITKIRYQKTNGDVETGTNKGEYQFPDEAALLIGGRAGEHVGFLLEASLKDGDSRFTSFRVPFVFNVGDDTKVSVIPFTTDAAGPSYGYELLNTGALRINRPIEHREQISAQQFLGTDTSATGIAFVVHRELYHANYTMWAHNHGDTDAGPYLHYARLAVTPTYAGWDLGAGVQWWGGTSKNNAAPALHEKADAWAIDAQAQGTVGTLPVGIYISYGMAANSDATGAANIFNASTTEDASAFAALVEVGVIPNRLTLAAGFLSGDASGSVAGMNGNTAVGSQTAYTLGANYQLAQNVNLVWNSSFHSGDTFDTNANGDQLHTAQIFAAY
ncbi:hypothetical protein MTYP_03063 [Methylophilaceae bacterium]|nr:hypothetical protein MTYP_03063 [Methylophilaceae bacterium]